MDSTKKLIGLIAFLVAVGMLLMMITNNRLVGLIIIALLLFLGYNCLCGD
jgi:4-hydroxybenzoate polyprenyltransferase